MWQQNYLPLLQMAHLLMFHLVTKFVPIIEPTLREAPLCVRKLNDFRSRSMLFIG